MFKTRIIIEICIFVVLTVFLSFKLLNVRADFIDNSSKLSAISVERYEEYYAKSEEDRLEGARTFIRIAHEPEFALAVIDPLIGLCIFFATMGFGSAIYYERRHAKLFNKSSKKDALMRASS